MITDQWRSCSASDPGVFAATLLLLLLVSIVLLVLCISFMSFIFLILRSIWEFMATCVRDSHHVFANTWCHRLIYLLHQRFDPVTPLFTVDLPEAIKLQLERCRRQRRRGRWGGVRQWLWQRKNGHLYPLWYCATPGHFGTKWRHCRLTSEAA